MQKPVSLLETTDGFGVVYNIKCRRRGKNRGRVQWLELKRIEKTRVLHGVQYWHWEASENIIDLEDVEVKDFMVLLPWIKERGKQEIIGEYTMVSKEWMTAMLEHYEYCKLGIAQESAFQKGVLLYQVDKNGVMAV